MAEAALGRVEQAAETLGSALALQEACRDNRVMAQPLFQVAVVWLWWDELERAKEAFEWLTRRAREMGDEGSLPYLLVLSAQVECVRGDLALAARHADEGYELADQGGQETLCAYLLALRACAHACAGEAERARETARRALELADRTSGRPAEHFARGALGLIELTVGKPAEAAAALGPLVEFLRREGIVEPGTARVVPDQIEALIALGDLDAAAELHDRFAKSAAQLERPSALRGLGTVPRTAAGRTRRRRGGAGEARARRRAERGRSNSARARPGSAVPRRDAPPRAPQARGAELARGGARGVRRHRREGLG